MFHTTLEQVPGYAVKEVIGIVRGNSVKAKWVGADFLSSIKNAVGGELQQYSRLMEEARQKAMADMDKDAEKFGANAVIGIRFQTSEIAKGAAEVLVYGTAVKLAKK